MPDPKKTLSPAAKKRIANYKSETARHKKYLDTGNNRSQYKKDKKGVYRNTDGKSVSQMNPKTKKVVTKVATKKTVTKKAVTKKAVAKKPVIKKVVAKKVVTKKTNKPTRVGTTMQKTVNKARKY